MKKSSKNRFLTTRKAPDSEAILYRSFELDRASVDESARTVALSFSSEMPVERYFGSEVLDHSASAVRLDRLNNGAPLLLNHDRDEQIGVVESATIDTKAKKGRAVVRFSKSEDGEEIFQDVMDGIRRLVSVGYRIHKTTTESKPGGVEIVRVTDWEPYEISLVSIPADDSVGVGRGATSVPGNHNSLSENNSMNRDQIIAALRAANIAFSDTATDDQLRALLPAGSPAPVPAAANRSAEAPAAPAVTVVREAAPALTQEDLQRSITAERQRTSTIGAIASQARSQGITVDEHRAIAEGLTADQFRTQVYDALISRQANFTPASLSRTEVRDLDRFDLGAALRSLASGAQVTGLEREILQQGEHEARAAGILDQGTVMLPAMIVRRMNRDLTATGTTSTTGDQGGQTIATQKVGLLDDFFNASIMRALGATILTGLNGNIDLPRLVAGTAAAKKAENASADEVTPTFATLSLTPKRLPAFIDISQQLLLQSSSAIEAMIRMHLTNQMLATQEAAFFHGGGTSEANGIAGTSGIGSVAGGTNGAAPTWAHLISLEEKVDAQNALGGSLRYASNGQIRAKLKQTLKNASGTDSGFILTDANPNVINGYGAAFTNAISRTLTKGSSSVASAIFFGNFADYVIGYWGGLSLELVRDTTNAKLGLYTLIANTYYDGGVVRPKSFSAMLDALGA